MPATKEAIIHARATHPKYCSKLGRSTIIGTKIEPTQIQKTTEIVRALIFSFDDGAMKKKRAIKGTIEMAACQVTQPSIAASPVPTVRPRARYMESFSELFIDFFSFQLRAS